MKDCNVFYFLRKDQGNERAVTELRDIFSSSLFETHEERHITRRELERKRDCRVSE